MLFLRLYKKIENYKTTRMQNNAIKQNTNKKKGKVKKMSKQKERNKNPQKAKQSMELILYWPTLYVHGSYLGM